PGLPGAGGAVERDGNLTVTSNLIHSILPNSPESLILDCSTRSEALPEAEMPYLASASSISLSEYVYGQRSIWRRVAALLKSFSCRTKATSRERRRASRAATPYDVLRSLLLRPRSGDESTRE